MHCTFNLFIPAKSLSHFASILWYCMEYGCVESFFGPPLSPAGPIYYIFPKLTLLVLHLHQTMTSLLKVQVFCPELIHHQ